MRDGLHRVATTIVVLAAALVVALVLGGGLALYRAGARRMLPSEGARTRS